MKSCALLLATAAAYSAPKADDLPGFEIAAGVSMPALNVGHPDDGSTADENVELWVSLGGRGIDTAYDYHNQAQIAEGVESVMKSGIKRTDLFITTKISPGECTREAALAAVKEDVKELDGITPDLVLHPGTKGAAVLAGTSPCPPVTNDLCIALYAV